VQLDYLSELDIDPLVNQPVPGETPRMSFGEASRVLGRGDYLQSCGVGSTTQVEVCAAVRNGRAEGVTICLQPNDPEVGDCVAREVRALGFPYHEQLDVTLTVFEPRK
jgi:hypothetical protein